MMALIAAYVLTAFFLMLIGALVISWFMQGASVHEPKPPVNNKVAHLNERRTGARIQKGER